MQTFANIEKKPVSLGPWGGQHGHRWDDGVFSTVRQLLIAHGTGIDSIQLEYDKKGVSIWSEKHGGNGGNIVDKVKLDYPDEYLTSVHGHYGSLNEWGSVFVRSLTFQSNKRTYGPFGVEEGTYFSFPMTEGKIVGFHGKSGWFLDAIGVHLKPGQKQKSSKALVQAKSFVNTGTENVGYSVIQGAAGNGYDIVVAVRQKEEYDNSPLKKPSKQISYELSDSAGAKAADKSSIQTPKLESLPPTPKAEGLITYGPWGGTGGSIFDDGIYTGIRQIYLSRSIAVVSMRVQYDRDGQAVWGSKHGGTGGFKTDKIIFDYPYEILTHISGTYCPLMYMGPHIIKSLTFHTNKGKHGPYGEEQGPSFSSKPNEGKIVGFHGREGLFLDAFGFHVREGKVNPVKHHLSDAIVQTERDVAQIENSPWSNKLVVAKRGPTEEVACSVVKEPAPCSPGPWGGDGGKPWDDGVYSGIKQIFITRTEAICSIEIEYDRNGQSLWSVKHGGNGGTITNRLKLEYPHEVLIRISGYYGPLNRDHEKPIVVKSITFHTTRGQYGPFGDEIGTFFTSTTAEGKVVGLHGRSSAYLDAIGVHMQHWFGNTNTKTSTRSSFFKIFS